MKNKIIIVVSTIIEYAIIFMVVYISWCLIRSKL